MRVRKSLLISMTIIALLIMSAPAMAQDYEQVDVYDQQKQLVQSVVFKLGVDQYFINNQTPGIKMDAKPFVENGRTFVPVRYLSKALGVTDEHIGWESPKVMLDEPGFPVVELVVDNKQLKSDNKTTTMDVSPETKQGRTYLPARWVAEALGYQVDWDAENSIVLCYPKGTNKPDISNVVGHIKGQAPVTSVQPEQPSVEGVIDLTGKGESIAGQPWAKYMRADDKITWLTNEEFNSNVYQLDDMKTYGMRVTRDKVYFTLEGGCGRVWLYEGGDALRVRESSRPTKAKYEYGYNVVNDRSDKYSNWPTADITKVSHIFLEGVDAFMAIENPLYQGGNE